MKVLFLTNIPSPYRVDFFHELGKLCELTVLYELPSADGRDAKWKSRQTDKSFQEIFMKPRFPGEDYAWCPEVTRYLKKDSYDFIIVGVYSTYTGMYAIRYMRRHKIPYLMNADGGFPAIGENPLKKALKKHFISGADGYLSTGAECDKYLTYYGADRGKIHHYPFTSLSAEDILDTPLTEQEKAKLRAKLGIPEQKVLLYVGRFIEGKGIDVLLDAAARLQAGRGDASEAATEATALQIERSDSSGAASEATAPQAERGYGIYLIGGEPTEEYLRLVQEYELENIHFLPFMTSDALRNYYMAADILVFPTRSDVWGLVVNEAMAAGLPVVTTDKCIAGMELLEGCGRVVPVDDARKLAEALEEILGNDALRRQMSGAAIEKIREYTVERMAQTHMEIFEEIKNGKGSENETFHS